MEEEGVFTAAFDTQLEWLIVKGIADVGNGEQATAESWESCASAMAASLVSHILSDPGVFRTWPHYPVNDDLLVAQFESRRKRKLIEHHAGALCDDQSSTQTKTGRFSARTSQKPESMTQQHPAGLPAYITEKIRQLYQGREGKLAPFAWCDYPSFNLNNIFTRLKIVNREATRGTLTDDEITNMTSIFRPHSKCKKPRKVLIEGDPGMGKTTYLQKLAYDWANKQNEWDASFPEIEVLLLLRLNDIKSSIWEAIDEQILSEDIDEKDKETFFKYIQENQSKVLLLLDGLDEADPCERDIYLSLVTCKLLPACHVIITSRHEVREKVSCDNLWEIVGFTKEDSKSFIRKYFQGKDRLAEKFFNYHVEHWYTDPPDPQHRGLSDLAKNPLNLSLLCCIFEDSEKFFSESSRTRLYIEIVTLALRRYEEKNGIESRKDQALNLISVYGEKLKLLGRFALDSLHKGKSYFEKEKDIDNFGFLSFQRGCTRRKPCTRCVFSHKSFQEFFAGFYLAFQVIDGQIDFADVLTDERYLKELKDVFLVMSGIIAFKRDEIGESILISMAEHISGLLRTSHQKVKSYMTLACACVFECDYSRLVKGKWKDEERELTCFEYTFGTHLDMSSLTEVDLSSAEIQNFGAAVISVVLEKNSSLTHLDLSFNLFDGVAPSLSKALKANSSLTSLNLKGNSIGEDGASSLSKTLKANSSLTDLNLSYNRIGDAGASFLSQALKANSSLTNLNLSINSIGDTGASSLSKALKANSSLTNLNLSFCKIGDAGASSISKALKANSYLTDLDLTGNRVGDTAASCLSKALKANSSLNKLDLTDNSVSPVGAASFNEASKINKKVDVRF
ncbi:unnamed protein product [Porites evermanni]|uniref:NACHT domain-containing protein n=1 Tax=Porites evermanni TaxID=104178 RepID=A0ABN8SQL6_9CNID|nr:unnamed protein product [Porites evermanni]